MGRILLIAASLYVALITDSTKHVHAQENGALLTAATVNEAEFDPDRSFKNVETDPEDDQSAAKKAREPFILKLQILLDRARMSPGEIDGRLGRNTEKALAAFERKMGLPEDGKLDADVWQKLTAGQTEPVLQEVQISEDDVKGPFAEKIPARFEDKAELKALSYETPAELLGERYHASPDLLKDLNPNARFDRSGTTLLVPRVRGDAPPTRVLRIVADKSRTAVEAYAEDGSLVAVYPATIGSDDTPTPDGETTVTKAFKNPWYTYDPRKLDFKEVQTNRVLKLAPGPNNPVGAVWIDLKREGYGIHGTPEPQQISKTSSHGCVRLTNWDALDLADLVEPGAQVIFSGG